MSVSKRWIYSGPKVWKISLIVVMVISFHQVVDDAIGPLMALCGKVQIDQGRAQTGMSQVLLNPADVDAGLQQMLNSGFF
jgi:hypothetical protein